MTQGGISSWCVKEGDPVQPGDVLAQVFIRFKFKLIDFNR